MILYPLSIAQFNPLAVRVLSCATALALALTSALTTLASTPMIVGLSSHLSSSTLEVGLHLPDVASRSGDIAISQSWIVVPDNITETL